MDKLKQIEFKEQSPLLLTYRPRKKKIVERSTEQKTGLQIAAQQDSKDLGDNKIGEAISGKTSSPKISAAAIEAAQNGASSPRIDSLPTRLQKQAQNHPNRPAYHVRSGKTWETTTYGEYWEQVRGVSKALMAHGVGPGDICTIYSNNRAEWCQFDLGLMNIGSASAGAYPDLDGKALSHVVQDSGSRILVVEDKKMFEKVAADVPQLQEVEHVVIMRGGKPAHPKAKTWAEFLEAGKDVSDAQLEKRQSAVRLGDLATLIYTSGTTGAPKGVMLSHRNLAWAGQSMRSVVGLKPSDTSVCYQRLGHIADRVFSVLGPITAGSSIYFSSALSRDLGSIQPTIHFGIPRVWELIESKIQSGTKKKLEKMGLMKRFMARILGPLVRRIGRKASEARNRGQEPRGRLYRWAARRMLRPVREKAGLSKARLCFSGAAPLSRQTEEYFSSLDIPLLNAYGQSETTGVISANRPGDNNPGTLGKSPEDVVVKLAEDGEILVKGDNVFMGYFKNAAATQKALRKGWLYTGDLGRFDAEGNLHMIGRKGRSGKLSNGEFVNPEPIENTLRASSIIGEAVAVFKSRKQVGACIVLDPRAVKELSQKFGIAEDVLHQNRRVIDAVQREIHKANQELEGFHRVHKFFIVDRPFEGWRGR